MSEIPQFEGEDREISYVLSPIPEGISEYAGQWVAIRARKVVIASENYDDVTNSDVFDATTDALYHVPEPGDHYYSQAA